VRRLRVEIARPVEDQIREQMLYIARDSVDNAFAWEERLLAAIRKLADFHGHAIDEDASQRLGSAVRKLVFERTYLVHYDVDERAGLVRVVSFRHGARRPRIGEP
jgi:plasmid stabilization system protein ParE